MTITLLLLALFALTAFDVWFTAKKVGELGLNAELSWTIRKLIPLFGHFKGVILGMAFWRVPFVAACIYFRSEVLLAIYVGFAANHGLAQAFVLAHQGVKQK